MIVLDTTVLVYSVGDAHRFRDPCRDLLAAVRDGAIEATTTPEVVQEFTHVRARRRGRDDATGLAGDYVDLLTPLLLTGEAELRSGLTIFTEQTRLGAFDAVLAAGALAAGAAALVSADAAFAGIDDLLHIVPDAAGVARLVAGPS